MGVDDDGDSEEKATATSAIGGRPYPHLTALIRLDKRSKGE